MAARWLRSLAAAPLMLGSLLLAAPQPARALVPYVVVPSPSSLEAAGIGIAQAATRLLRMGQAEEAAQLAGRSPLAVSVLVPALRAAGHTVRVGRRQPGPDEFCAADAASAADWVWLTVPDDQIAATAAASGASIAAVSRCARANPPTSCARSGTSRHKAKSPKSAYIAA